jgi:hypothetical protein
MTNDSKEALKGFVYRNAGELMYQRLNNIKQFYIQNSTACNVLLASLPVIIKFVSLCFSHMNNDLKHHFNICSSLFSSYQKHRMRGKGDNRINDENL